MSKKDLAHCYELPTASEVKRYITEVDGGLSLSYNTASGPVLLVLHADGDVMKVTLNSKRKFAASETNMGIVDILSDYTDDEEVHLDPVSLLKVLWWLKRPRCKKEDSRTAALERIDASVSTYLQAHSQTKSGKGTERLLLARRYLLDGIGAYGLLLDEENAEAEDLLEKDQPMTKLLEPNTEVEELIRVATEVHQLLAKYIREYKSPNQRSNKPTTKLTSNGDQGEWNAFGSTLDLISAGLKKQ